MSPFYHIPYFPAFDRMTPESADEALSRLVPEANASVDALETTFVPTWTGLMRPLREACQPLYDAWALLSHMLSVMNSDAWRQVQEKWQPEIVSFSLRVGQSRTFYQAYLALRAADKTAPLLTDVQRRILDKAILGAEQAGVGLPPEQQARFNAVQMELARIATSFRNNVLDATKASRPPC